jgi:hypothetical protein
VVVSGLGRSAVLERNCSGSGALVTDHFMTTAL